MITEAVIRTFDTPTDIVILGAKLSWIRNDTWFADKLDDNVLNALALCQNNEIELSDFGVDVMVSPMGYDLCNGGTCTILTVEELKKLKDVEYIYECETVHIDGFKGSIQVAVVDEDEGFDMMLNDNYRKTNLMDNLVAVEGLDRDRYPVIRLKGAYRDSDINRSLEL